MFFDSKKCTICPGGYFQNSDGKNQCIECSVGYYRPNFSRKQDAKFCLECDDQNEPGKTVCPGCEFGFGLELNAMYNKNDKNTTKHCSTKENVLLPTTLIKFAVHAMLDILIMVAITSVENVNLDIILSLLL